MSDSSDNAAASAVCDNADDATEAEACCVTQHCKDHCVATEEHDLAQANYDSDSDESHQPNQVNQLTEQIHSHLNIDESEASEDETESNPKNSEEPKNPLKIPETQSELEELYENILEQRDYSFTQIADPAKVSKELTLQNAASEITRKMGLHVPVLHMNCKHYCTMMQMNDGGMDYLSLLQGGGPRLWLIVPSDYTDKLEEYAVKLLKRIRAEQTAKQSRPDTDPELPDCRTPLMHKMIALGPRQLRNAGIPFEISMQHAGDLVYVKHHTMHQVVDIGSSIVETANVGNSLWLENAFKFDMCACNHEGVRAVNLRYCRVFLRKQCKKAHKNAKAGRSKRK